MKKLSLNYMHVEQRLLLDVIAELQFMLLLMYFVGDIAVAHHLEHCHIHT